MGVEGMTSTKKEMSRCKSAEYLSAHAVTQLQGRYSQKAKLQLWKEGKRLDLNDDWYRSKSPIPKKVEYDHHVNKKSLRKHPEDPFMFAEIMDTYNRRSCRELPP